MSVKWFSYTIASDKESVDKEDNYRSCYEVSPFNTLIEKFYGLHSRNDLFDIIQSLAKSLPNDDELETEDILNTIIAISTVADEVKETSYVRIGNHQNHSKN